MSGSHPQPYIATAPYSRYNIERVVLQRKELLMTTTTVQSVVAAAQQLSPSEQLEIIQALTQVLQARYPFRTERPLSTSLGAPVLPTTIRRTPPVTNLADFAADFWPEDESADDINTYITEQRRADRLRQMPDMD
jgi:hypothetical protein